MAIPTSKGACEAHREEDTSAESGGGGGPTVSAQLPLAAAGAVSFPQVRGLSQPTPPFPEP